MDSAIDIVVTSRDLGRPELVVEVKASDNVETATKQIISYMQRVGAPFGLVVTTRTIRFLRDTYRASGADSVRVVFEEGTDGIPELRLPAGERRSRESELEARVQAWLESLANPASVERLPDQIRSAVSEYIVPIIESGVVRAAGPRSGPDAARAG